MTQTNDFYKRKLNEAVERNSRNQSSKEKKWRDYTLEPWNKKTKYKEKKYVNSSNINIKDLYTKEDVPQNEEYLLGFPGEYPFTRGVYPNMYRGKYWTMRMFSGFGTPEDTNSRLKYLISHGETGLSS